MQKNADMIGLSEQHFMSIETEMFLVDSDGHVVFANQSFCRHVGLYKASGRRFVDLVERHGRLRARRSLQAAVNGKEQIQEYTFFNGAVSILKLIPLQSNSTPAMVAGLAFVSSPAVPEDPRAHGELHPREAALAYKGLSLDRLQLEHRLELAELNHMEAVKASSTDQLTGLLNRTGFDRDIQKEVMQAGAERAEFYLVHIDLEGLKRVKDMYGHRASDRLLCAIARRLKAPQHVVSAARVGDEEFAVLVRAAVRDPQKFAEAVGAIWPRLFRPVLIGGQTLTPSASAGIAAFGDDAPDPESVKCNADIALLEARQGGKQQIRLFDQSLAAHRKRRHAVERALDVAVESQRLYPVYQPIMPSKEGLPRGVEVLARWQDETLGQIGPEEFIRVAAQGGILSKLDLLIVRKACADLAPLIKSGMLDFVTFNMPPRELSQESHVEAFVETARASGLPLTSIWIEITEPETASDFATAKAATTRLRAAGIRVALEDYGKGRSDFSVLLDLPIEVLKIDRSLVAGLVDQQQAMRIVRSIIQMSQVSGAQIVAEGAETHEQAAVARAMGCQYVQGFAVSKPLALCSLPRWLNERAGTNRPMATAGDMPFRKLMALAN